MLYSTFIQPTVFVVLFCAGLVCGISYDGIKFLCLKLHCRNFFKQIIIFFHTILWFFVCFLLNLYLSFGQARIYVPLAFLLALFLQQKLCGKLWKKLAQKLKKKA